MQCPRIVAGLCFALIALSAASSAHAELKTQWVDYSQGGTPLRGYLAYTTTASRERAQASSWCTGATA